VTERMDAVNLGSAIVAVDAATAVVEFVVAIKEAAVRLVLDEVVTKGSTTVLVAISVEVSVLVSPVLRALATVDNVMMGSVGRSDRDDSPVTGTEEAPGVLDSCDEFSVPGEGVLVVIAVDWTDVVVIIGSDVTEAEVSVVCAE
jgi:hypothetical protein